MRARMRRLIRWHWPSVPIGVGFMALWGNVLRDVGWFVTGLLGVVVVGAFAAVGASLTAAGYSATWHSVDPQGLISKRERRRRTVATLRNQAKELTR